MLTNKHPDFYIQRDNTVFPSAALGFSDRTYSDILFSAAMSPKGLRVGSAVKLRTDLMTSFLLWTHTIPSNNECYWFRSRRSVCWWICWKAAAMEAACIEILQLIASITIVRCMSNTHGGKSCPSTASVLHTMTANNCVGMVLCFQVLCFHCGLVIGKCRAFVHLFQRQHAMKWVDDCWILRIDPRNEHNFFLGIGSDTREHYVTICSFIACNLLVIGCAILFARNRYAIYYFVVRSGAE